MAYTEFYCQSGGSNLNSGSTTTGSVYTSIHGNWTQSTGVFTPTDSTNPSSTVSVGMWGSVYIDGATVGVWVARITVVTNATNGAITVNTAGLGAKPANQTGTATLVVGGPWLGPNAASGFPFTLATFGNQIDTTSHAMRVNMKNDQTYSLTSSITFSNTGSGTWVVQGYTSSVGDGGKATWDGSTSTGAVIASIGTPGSMIDHIFVTSISSGTADLVTSFASGAIFIRCVFHGARGNGLLMNGATSGQVIECEAYDCDKSNTANLGGFRANGMCVFLRSISHDNTTGANCNGFALSPGASTANLMLINCVADTNAGNGATIVFTNGNSLFNFQNNDFYNNTGDAINIPTSTLAPVWIENNNFFKNGGRGINNVSVVNWGYSYNNVYGAGTQANGSSDTLNNITEVGKVTYTSNLTPWVDPANGNFSQLYATSIVGRGAFTETASSYAGTIGYPNTGAAQANTPVKSGGFS